MSGLVVATGMLAVVIFTVLSKYFQLKQKPKSRGITTEVAILLMYLVGVLLVLGNLLVAVVVGAGTAILLQFKPELHKIVNRLGDDDLRAIMRFALITFVILPVLPNETYGPLNVLNPFEIWLMVVLIVGISLGGYIAYKYLGERSGSLLSGLLGGAISSTATTMICARRSRLSVLSNRANSLIVLLASCMVYLRVLVEMAIISPRFLTTASQPICIMLGVGLLSVGLLLFRREVGKEHLTELENPTELKSAMVFGLMYAFVVFSLALAQKYWGGEGLYAVAFLSGMTDMDAITLSTSQMVQDGMTGEGPGLESRIGWRLIVVANISNLVFKAGIVAVLGGQRFFWTICLLFSLQAVTGGLLLALWP